MTPDERDERRSVNWIALVFGGLAIVLTLYRVTTTNREQQQRFEAGIREYDKHWAEMKAKWDREDEERRKAKETVTHD